MDTASINCTSCDASIPADAAFCPFCGARAPTELSKEVGEQFEPRLKAALEDRYRIEHELGRGGMAIVFLATDLKHDRQVAMKVFRPEMAASMGVERFLREIQITAKLSHPHILPLYDSGEADGFLYYVMPYIEGETLADLMVREKQLPIPDAVRITREVAEALAQAHSYGLVHRDIKPQNIMLSGGHAVVADFGISRAVSVAGGEKLTQTGMAIGTPAYMSPEQWAGDENVDGRSDVYSLGCVLYEMLVGQVPFTGPTPQAVMARHTIDTAPPPSVMRDTIPETLEDVVYRALAKSPADRFRTALEFAEALDLSITGEVPQRTGVTGSRHARRRSRSKRPLIFGAAAVLVAGMAFTAWKVLSNGPAGGESPGMLDPTRVAVLYLQDLSAGGQAGGQMEYVADGFTEALIARLSAVRALDVVSSNGVAAFKGEDVSPDSIARVLRVGSVITGSVEQTGDRLRVTLRLVDGTSGADIERTSFELPAAELLAARDSVATRASGLLRQRLGEEVRLREDRAATASVEAWAFVQRAERLRKAAEDLLLESRLEDAARDFQEADSILALAEAADPDWVEPLVRRAHIAFRRGRTAVYGGDVRAATEQIEVGVSHANRALALSPNNAGALEQRGTLQFFHWLLRVTPDPAEADRLFRSAREDLEAAVRFDPTLATAHSMLSLLLINTDDQVTMLLEARRAYEEDAYLADAAQILNRVFFGYYNLGELTEAEHWCEEGARRFANDYLFQDCQLRMMVTDRVDPDVDRAWQLVERLAANTPEDRREYWRRRGEMFVAGVIGRTGDLDSARAVLLQARGDREIDPDHQLAEFEAYVRTTLGEYDEAIDLLKTFVAANPDQAFKRDEDLPWYWEPLKDRPGFEALQTGRR